jgi:hypothetical protein
MTTTTTTTIANDLYFAADERACEACRASLQAKKDEQLLNTAQSYASKQREWKVLPLCPLSPPSFSLSLPRTTDWPTDTHA